MTNGENEYPSPLVKYLGSSLVVHAANLRVGTAAVARVPLQKVGTAAVLSHEDGIPNYTLRPAHKPHFDDDPCDFQFNFAYDQNGLEWDMVFNLKCDDQGGVVGTAAELEVNSNYPDIDMTIPKSTFSHAGLGFSKRLVLPKDYTAEMRFKFWLQGRDPAIDGSILFETLFVKTARPQPILVRTSRSTLYPSLGGPETRVLGNAYEISGNGEHLAAQAAG